MRTRSSTKTTEDKAAESKAAAEEKKKSAAGKRKAAGKGKVSSATQKKMNEDARKARAARTRARMTDAERGQADKAAAEERRRSATPLTNPAEEFQPSTGESSLPPVTPQRPPSASPGGTAISQRTTRSQTDQEVWSSQTTPRKAGVVVKPTAVMRKHLDERKRAEGNKSPKEVRSLSELIELSGPPEWIEWKLITSGLETRGLEEDVVQAIYDSMMNPSTGKHVIFDFSLHK